MKFILMMLLMAATIIAIGVLIWVSGHNPEPPKTVPELIEGVFGYRMTGELDVVSREYVFPSSIHGVHYSEHTVLRLSALDYSQLVACAMADKRFTKRVYNGHAVYDWDYAGDSFSWASNDEEKTFSYSYVDQ